MIFIVSSALAQLCLFLARWSYIIFHAVIAISITAFIDLIWLASVYLARALCWKRWLVFCLIPHSYNLYMDGAIEQGIIAALSLLWFILLSIILFNAMVISA
jgi:hypothetical protein